VCEKPPPEGDIAAEYNTIPAKYLRSLDIGALSTQMNVTSYVSPYSGYSSRRKKMVSNRMSWNDRGIMYIKKSKKSEKERRTTKETKEMTAKKRR
jgi:hypothetical protein